MANSHTSVQRAFIVRRLAAFEPPRAIVLDFMALFPDTRCDENDVRALNPEIVGALQLGPDLYTEWKIERERVMLDPGSAPYAEQKARLILLSNHVKFHNSNNEMAVARSVVRQIAEEVGAVGGANKGGKAPGAAEKKPGEPVTEIIVTVVDPVKPGGDA